MSYQDENPEDIWDGLEPPRTAEPESGNRLLMMGLIAVALLGVTLLCLGGGYLLWRQTEASTPPPTALAVPTLPGSDTTVLVVTVEVEEPTPDGSDVTVEAAPTVTLPPPEPTATNPPNVEAAGLLIPRFAAPASIDADPAEWSAALPIVSGFRVFRADGWDGTEDLTANWQLAWDANNLYLYVTVIDDIHVQTATGNQIFRGDSVDIQIDTQPNNGITSSTPFNYQVTFSPGDFGSILPSYFRFQGQNNGSILDAQTTEIVMAAAATDTGYVIEAAIPWTTLSVTPASGVQLGMALNASDNDTPGTAVQEVMMSHIATRTLFNPKTWGLFVLE